MHPAKTSVADLAPLFWSLLLTYIGYRLEMPVRDVMIFSSFYGKTGYYVCPRCGITLEREFMSFCDRCGQHLGWRGYKNAEVIYPGNCKKVHT